MSTPSEGGQRYRLRDRRPETRGFGEAWRPWHPDPMISPSSPVVQFFAEQLTCAHCAEPVTLATLVAAIQRGTWPDYCGPRHRSTAAKRRQRARR